MRERGRKKMGREREEGERRKGREEGERRVSIVKVRQPYQEDNGSR